MAGLLRKGIPVIDLCVYLGDNPPVKLLSHRLPEIPEGYNFDVCTTDALINRTKALNGDIGTAGWYEISYVGPAERL